VVMKQEYSHNRIVFRASGENRRIGMKSLNKTLIKKEMVIQDGCPF